MSGLTINGKSPANPSRTATARVGNPLPAPTTCPHCGGPVKLVENDVIYGRHYGDWPFAYDCRACDAYVGLHPFTAIPLGTLATRAMRDARQQAKAAFNPLWLDKKASMSRTEAYAWLAGALGIADVEQCHIGWFDVAQCKRVVEVCSQPRQPVPRVKALTKPGVLTSPANFKPLCNCAVLAWEHCEHTLGAVA
jgi:hypothetical protein